jgi:hypothetical protein
LFDRASRSGGGLVTVADVLAAARFGAGQGWPGCGTPAAWAAIDAMTAIGGLSDGSTMDKETSGSWSVSVGRRRYQVSAALAEAVQRAHVAGRVHRLGGFTVAMVIGAIVAGDSPIATKMRLAAGSVDLPVTIARLLGDPGLSIMVGLMIDPAGQRSAGRAIALWFGGWAVALAGAVVAAMVLLGIGAVFAAGVGSSLLYPIGTLGVLVAGAAIRAGARARAKSRRQLAANAVHVLLTDPRTPVLYLRSFDTDQAAGRIGDVGGTAAYSGVALVSSGNLAQSRFTEEEQLARALNHLGPPVAIGRPGEALPFAGAARLYVGTAAWQDVVVELLARSALVVIGLSRHDGVLWELREAVGRVAPTRLVLLVTSGVGEYQVIRERTATLFPVPLPDPVAVSAAYQVGIRAVVLFTDDWTPSIVPIAHPGVTPRMPVEWGCVQALRPVFERAGARWPGRRWRYRARGYLPHIVVAGLVVAVPLALLIIVLIVTA